MSKKPFKVGQRVWSPQFGWGKASEIRMGEVYPVEVEFGGCNDTCTADGKACELELRASLFHNEVPADQWPDPDPPLPYLAVDTPVWVRIGTGVDWSCRHFATWEDGKMFVFANGKTSHSSDTEDTVFVTEWSLTKPEGENGS